MRICISTYSFMKLVRQGKMTLFDVIKKVKEMGFEGIEFSNLLVPEGEELLRYAEKLGEACRKESLPVALYACRADLLEGSDGNLEKEIERLKQQITAAGLLGAPVMRHDLAWGFPKEYSGVKTFDAVLPRLVEGTRELIKYANAKGIITCTENHGQFCQDSERMLKIVTEVRDARFGLLVDMGNFSCVDEDSTIAVGKLAGNALHVHAKDMFLRSGFSSSPGEGYHRTRSGNWYRPTIIGHGHIPVYQCLSILQSSGYKGWIGIEYEGMEPVMEAIQISYENLKQYVSMQQ